MTNQLTGARQRPLSSWPQAALRIGFGAIWAIDAVLKWLPGFRSAYVNTVTSVTQGQPGWLRWWFDFWVRLQTPHAGFFAYLMAVLETLVALAVILGFARKLAYAASAAFSVMIWAVAEGFGGPYMSGSTDIGTAVIYAVVFTGLLVVAYYAGTDRCSADYYLEQRISWWWKVAEIRRPASVERIVPVPVPAPAPAEEEIVPDATVSAGTARRVGIEARATRRRADRRGEPHEP